MSARVLGGLLAWAAMGVAAATMLQSSPARASDVGIVSNVKVSSDKSEDVSNSEAWKATYIKEGMTDEQKALAIWRTVVKYRHQDNPPNEGVEESGNVHEPFKTFNVYGYGMCCCASADIEGLARYVGLTARGRILNNHSVPEIWYGGAWHLFDASMMFYVKKSDGQVASVDEMKQSIMDFLKDKPGKFKNDADWKKFGMDEGWKKGPPLFATCEFFDKNGINRAGYHGWWTSMEDYNWKQVAPAKIVVPPDTNGTFNVYDYGAVMGYQVNVQLRDGEKLTRCWYATDLATGLNRNSPKRVQKFLAGDMAALGLQKDFGDLAPGCIGNGVLEYDVMADSKLQANALKCENLTAEGGKVRIADPAKPATLIVRMPCSYLYLGGEMTVKPVIGPGGSVAASISYNNGQDWKEVARFDKSEEQKIDLKPLVFNRYDYQMKFEIAGAGTGLDALRIVHAIQHSQAPLPIITEGSNKITFSAGPQEGTVTIQGNMQSDQAGKANWIGDYHPVVDGCDVKFFAVGKTGHGTAILPVSAPGDITRIRMGIHWRARDPKDNYVLSASFDEGKTWKQMGQLDQANPAKSAYLIFSDVPAGARSAQLKFEGSQKNSTAIFDLRVDVDYKEPAGGFRPVKVTYTWEEHIPGADAVATASVPPAKGRELLQPEKPPGTLKTDVHVCNTPTDSWTINCGPGTVAKSYTVELVK